MKWELKLKYLEHRVCFYRSSQFKHKFLQSVMFLETWMWSLSSEVLLCYQNICFILQREL